MFFKYFAVLVALNSCSVEKISSDSFEHWRRVSLPDEDTFNCSNHSPNEWRVEPKGEGVIAIPNNGRENDSLPFEKSRSESAFGVEFTGSRRAISVDDGYLVGYDAGEFGGGLWWFSKDGALETKLTLRQDQGTERLAENVHEIVRTPKGFLVAQGLAHLGSNSGRVSLVNKASDGRWVVSQLVELPSTPYAMIAESPSSVLLGLSSGVARLDLSGVLTVIYDEPKLGYLYPNSVVLAGDGTIYMGMREFVLELAPKGKYYDVTYLTRADCESGSCVCGENA